MSDIAPRRSIPHGARFSSAAGTYDEYASVQRIVAGHLVDRIRDLPPPARILDIGCGTGALTEALRACFPEAQIDALDVAPDMIRVCRQKWPDDRSIRWVVADVMAHRTDSPYDLIASSSALQWVRPVNRALKHIVSLLAPGGRLAMAVMMRRTLEELYDGRRAVAPDKTPTARLPAFGTFRRATRNAGLRLEHAHRTMLEKRYAGGAELLRALNRQGVTGGEVSRGAHPLTRTELKKLIAWYERHHSDPEGRVPARYETGYFIAQRGPRP